MEHNPFQRCFFYMRYTDISRKDQILYRSDNFFIIEETFPVSPGHLLIISNSEKDYFDLNAEEHLELQRLIHKCKDLIESVYSPDGYDIGINYGEPALQIFPRFLCNVIPKYSEI